jgi:hypothetical protein
MYGMRPTETAILLQLQLVGGRLFIFGGRIVAAFAFTARQGNEITHG